MMQQGWQGLWMMKIKKHRAWRWVSAVVLGIGLTLPLHAQAQSDTCTWLAGEYQIMWPNAAPQPMRISVQGTRGVQVEIAAAPDLWIKQPLESVRNQDGMLPPCVLMVIDYGMFSTTRNLSGFLNEDPGEAWAFLTRDKPIPVRKISGVGAYQAKKT